MSRKSKSPEIQRFLAVMSALNETPATLEAKTGISARTVNNAIWNDTPLSGRLLRALCDQFDVSVDWLLTGSGSMLRQAENNHPARLLLPFFETVDVSTVQDYWWLCARAAEESLVESGAVPGVDYSRVDLYQLAAPLVTSRLCGGDLVLQVHEAAG